MKPQMLQRRRPLNNSGKCIVQLALAIGSDADPAISIKGGGGLFFAIKQKSDFKQFVLRKINRYRGIIQSEN